MKTILDLVKANVELSSLSGKLEEATEANKNLQAEIEGAAASHADEVAKLGAQHAEDIEALEQKVKLLEETNYFLRSNRRAQRKRRLKSPHLLALRHQLKKPPKSRHPRHQ